MSNWNDYKKKALKDPKVRFWYYIEKLKLWRKPDIRPVAAPIGEASETTFSSGKEG